MIRSQATRRRAAAAPALVLALAGCGGSGAAPELAGPPPAAPRLFLDVHRLGPGGASLADVEAAHARDLAVQDAYGVDYRRYWVDEEAGHVYCLVAAPSADAAAEVHREAHGLVADEVVPVRPGVLPAAPTGAGRLFLDTHDAGPGAVTYADVADAHREDLAVQERFGVRFLEYWVDEASGRIHCLAEAPSGDAVVEAHRAAHGLLPDALHEVVPGG